MEETVPIIHSHLMRCNRNFSKNPYGVILWYLRVTFRNLPADDTARNGA
ncbi:hypothetical protein AWB83_03605 [Caballeronia ptereochthonis]|uniref:Uncharacterized protein n=1 Tax=Caballeronia ptereochthonis TaxID=1777144 RepID=A0A158BVH5_9BURK|nr:hypothetical protein AWB83_03605 [Caballeronia ptereochthonis]